MADRPAQLGDIIGYTDYFDGKGTQNAQGAVPADLLDQQIKTVMQNTGVGRGEAAQVVGVGYVKAGKEKGLSQAQITAQVQNLQKDLIGNTLPMLSNLPRVTTIAEMVAIPVEVIGIALAVYFGAPIVAIIGGIGILGFTIAQIPKIWYDTNVVAKSQTVQALKFTDEILAGKYDAKPAKLEGLAQEEIDGLFSALQIDGVTAFNDPIAQQSIALTPAGLERVIKDAANQLRASGKNPTVSKLLAAVRLMTIGGTSTNVAVASTPTQSVRVTSAPSVKVFTGVVTQGKLGDTTAFVARETDLIDNMEELLQAAQNNLASYLVSLPGKIIYKIRVVNSVTGKDGFTQHGTTQQIVAGYTTKGAPKYKTITNRFAQLWLYFDTGSGSPKEIGKITLGPVNAASFNPTGAQVTVAEGIIAQNIHTTDVTQISTIVTPQSIAVQAPPAPVYTAPVATQKTAEDVRIEYGFNNVQTAQNLINGAAAAGITVASYWRQLAAGGARAIDAALGVDVKPAAGSAPAPLPFPSSSNPNKCNVATISDFYGGIIPDGAKLAERAKMYEVWGLGSAAYYTGTAEQNTKWLREAQKRSGC